MKKSLRAHLRFTNIHASMTNPPTMRPAPARFRSLRCNIESAVYEKIRERARREGRSVASWLRIAVERALGRVAK